MGKAFTSCLVTWLGLGIIGCGGGWEEPGPLEGLPSASTRARGGQELKATAIDEQLGRAAIDDWLGQADMAVRFHYPADCVRYVDWVIPFPGDGMSWDGAFQTVQKGIDAAHQAVLTGPRTRARARL